MPQDKLEILEHNFIILRSYGVYYMMLIETSIIALQKHHAGEINLTPDQIDAFVNSGMNATTKYMNVLKMNHQEKMNYIDEDIDNEE